MTYCDMRKAVQQVHIDDAIYEYILRLVEQTRNSELVAVGSSMRGALALTRCARVWAAADNRAYVIPDQMSRPTPAISALAHRLTLTPDAAFRRPEPAQCNAKAIIDDVPVPQTGLNDRSPPIHAWRALTWPYGNASRHRAGRWPACSCSRSNAVPTPGSGGDACVRTRVRHVARKLRGAFSGQHCVHGHALGIEHAGERSTGTTARHWSPCRIRAPPSTASASGVICRYPRATTAVSSWHHERFAIPSLGAHQSKQTAILPHRNASRGGHSRAIVGAQRRPVRAWCGASIVSPSRSACTFTRTSCRCTHCTPESYVIWRAIPATTSSMTT